MACAALSTNSCTIASSSSTRLSFSTYQKDSKLRQRHRLVRFRVRASTDDSDCNAEECAPEKEVGKVSMEWLAGDNTKVVGTFPPRKPRGWTGYVEKDTAGQTNIYSVEPAVYVAESAFSSGTAGTSSDGAESTIAVSSGIGLIAVAAASLILLQVGKNSPPPIQTVEYSGPSLSYYINKFKTSQIVQASVTEVPTGPETQVESSAPQIEVQSEAPLDTSSSSSNTS